MSAVGGHYSALGRRAEMAERRAVTGDSRLTADLRWQLATPPLVVADQHVGCRRVLLLCSDFARPTAEFGRRSDGDLGRRWSAPGRFWDRLRLEPQRTRPANRRFGLHMPLSVLTSGTSISGVLWWSSPLALTRTTRPQDIAGRSFGPPRRPTSPSLPLDPFDDAVVRSGGSCALVRSSLLAGNAIVVVSTLGRSHAPCADSSARSSAGALV